MALKLQFEILRVDKFGRVITVRDVTGDYHPDDNPGGYGAPNISRDLIQGIAYTISEYCSNKVHTGIAVRGGGLDIDVALAGGDVDLNSIFFGITEPEQGLSTFRDGIQDLNYYVFAAGVPVQGEKGKNFVTGPGLTAVQGVDSVLIGGRMYDVRKNLPTGDGTTLFLTEMLEQDATSLNPAYRANDKVYIDRFSRCVMSRMSGKLAEGLCKSRGGAYEELRRRLLTIKHNRDASRIDYQESDFAGADEKLRYAETLSLSLDCGCK